MKRLTGLIIFLNCLVAYSQPARLAHLNLDHFTKREKNKSADFYSLVDKKFFTHPELGVMPFAAPQKANYIELIDRRDAYSRFFVREKSGGKSFIIQKANSPINFQDDSGYWREINYRLEPKSDRLFTASGQPNPVSIDLEQNFVTISNSGKSIRIINPELVWKEPDGNEHSLGTARLDDFTAGDEGIKIINFYPGIDLVYSVSEGQIETSFVLNNMLPYRSGEIVLRQEMILPENFTFRNEKSIEEDFQDIYIVDDKNISYFNIEKGNAFEDRMSSAPYRIKSKVRENRFLEFAVSVDWLTEPGRIYPVVIDPLITTQNTIAPAGIAGTKFSPVCWTNGCDYNMTVATPPNATVTGIEQSFGLYATGLCFAEDGGWSLGFGTCLAPSGAPGVYTNPVHFTNAFCTVTNLPVPEFNACLPAPQCASQNLNFTLHFFRCNNDPDTNCASNCVRATQPWIMYVEGYTLQLFYLSPSQQVCGNSNADLVCVPEYGVPPYTFSWLPGGSVNDTLSVSPVSSAIYTVTVTDACGSTFSDTTSVNITANNNPGFTITPNPVCQNSNVTLSGNGSGAVNNYDWIVSGSNAPGGIVNDTQSPVISYNLPGTYDVILKYPNGSCTFNDTIPVTVSAPGVTDVSLTAFPSVSVCNGDTVTFRAAPVNGGATPSFEFLINGISVQNGLIDSLLTDTLSNGSSVQVILTTSQACSSPAVDTASLFMSVSGSLVPQVTISPDTSVCAGSLVTLTAFPVNGGTTPDYQWYANGNPVAGATSSSYSFVVTPPDTVISIEMFSSFSCVSPSVAIDTSTVNILQNISPLVTIVASPPGTVCAGDTVTYTARQTNGGTLPQFQWFVNGVGTAVTDSIFTFFPNDNDSISVRLISSLICVIAPSDDDYTIADVSPSVSPSVTMSASPSVIVCQNDTITFTASAINAGSAPVYSWSVNGNPVGINDSVFISSTLSDNDRIQVIVSSSLSCAPVPSDTDAVMVSITGNVTPAVSISSSAGGQCEGVPVQFIANGNSGGPAPAYQWFVNGVATGMTNDTIILTTLLSSDTIRVSMTSSLGCVSPSTVMSQDYLPNLLPRVMPQIDIVSSARDTVCIGEQAVINAHIQNGGSAPVIQWYLNSILMSETSTTFVTDFAQGDVIVANMVSNANCLIMPGDTSNFIRIVYHQPLSVQLTSGTPDCPGVSDTLVAHPSGGNGGPYDIYWNNTLYNNDSLIIVPGRNSNVYVEVTDNCTTEPGRIDYQVPVLPGPVAEFGYVNPQPGSFQNNIQFINFSIDADSWTWYFPYANYSTTDLNVLHQFPDEGVYEVMLATVNNSGCTDTVVYNVTVKEEIAVFYPNSFTPNGDGVNDVFRPMGASLEDYTMIIFDRWGKKVYEGDNNSAWDGKINHSSTFAPEGVYVFRIELEGDKFETKEVTGKITLIR